MVPDGALWELPFQALETPDGHYLLEDCAIAYAPSLTVLREMIRLRGTKSRDADEAAPQSLLAMGNPALGRQTAERVKLAYRDEKLDALPEAEKEVKTLGQLYGAGRLPPPEGVRAPVRDRGHPHPG